MSVGSCMLCVVRRSVVCYTHACRFLLKPRSHRGALRLTPCADRELIERSKGSPQPARSDLSQVERHAHRRKPTAKARHQPPTHQSQDRLPGSPPQQAGGDLQHPPHNTDDSGEAEQELPPSRVSDGGGGVRAEESSNAEGGDCCGPGGGGERDAKGGSHRCLRHVESGGGDATACAREAG